MYFGPKLDSEKNQAAQLINNMKRGLQLISMFHVEHPKSLCGLWCIIILKAIAMYNTDASKFPQREWFCIQ